ncbi:putative rhomboid protease [Elasticomyces elasticus]|nr:putative rhomboid protease [Elasticomyces elasticus]KAK4969726.1 putative rhomboid protease [Elasticomyces elasticus]
MSSSFSLPDARRIRSYVLRLPLCTRGLLLIITGAYFAHLFWAGLTTWGALIPKEIGISTLYRLNTFPLIHGSILHFLLNSVALVPLLERFESEHGTIVTFLLFTGAFGLLPGAIYTIVQLFILHHNTAAIGASIWVFLLLSNESIKTYKANPHFVLGDVKIPTWTPPLALILVIWVLVPGTSLLGHLCGALVGYGWGLGYIRFLAPPDWILRFIEGKLNLLGRLPHYVSVDQKTFGRYGVLPSTTDERVGPGRGTLGVVNGIALGSTGEGQRLGP